MKAKIRPHPLRRFHIALLLPLLACQAAAHSAFIIDAGGFEPSASYSTTFDGTGRLDGQSASIDGGTADSPWRRSPTTGPSTAVVQSGLAANGIQSVRIDRAPNEDARWAVLVNGYPTRRYVTIEWRMRVDASGGSGFGPFIGLEAYDPSDLRIGMFGVDATTGELLFTDRDTGFIAAAAPPVAFGTWNLYRIEIDFQTGTYSGWLNGSRAFITDFETAGISGFSDADIAAVSAAGDPTSLAQAGTAHIDDLTVSESNQPITVRSDTWGNTAVSSLSPDGPAFAFTDISSTGTPLALSSGSLDDGAAMAEIPGGFPFYGEILHRLSVSTNGYLSTDPNDGGGDFSSDIRLPAPPSTGSGGRIYVLHDDLAASPSGGIHFQYFPDGIPSHPFLPDLAVSVIQWTGFIHLSGATLFSFQALLFENGAMYFAYPDGDPKTGTSATVGFQNAAADAGALITGQYPGAIPSGSAIGLTPAPMVTSLADSGPGTLRETLGGTTDMRTITFDGRVFDTESGKTITLSSPLENPLESVIDASSVAGVTLDAAGSGRILSNQGTLTLDSLNLTGGLAASGPAVLNSGGSLTVNNCSIHRNTGNGAVHSDGPGAECTISNSTIAFNSGTFGTGFLSRGGSAGLHHVTIANNSAGDGTAGIVHEAGVLTLDGCLVSNTDSTNADRDIGGAGATLIAASPNLIRSLHPSNAYSPSFPPSPVVGSPSSPVEPLLVGDGVSGLIGEPLASYGGPTLSLLPLPGSPAVDASNNLSGTDQNGMPPLGLRDLGAVETRWDDNTSSTPPADIAADITNPGDAVAGLPFGSPTAVSELLGLIDNLAGGHFFNSEINEGFTVTPSISSAPLTGITITSRSTNSAFATDGFPSEFLLLGTDDLNRFQLLVAGNLPSVTGANESRTVHFPNPLPVFRSYRILFPRSTNPNGAVVSFGEVALLGTPPLPRPVRITGIAADPVTNTVSLAFDSVPGQNYFLDRADTPAAFESNPSDSEYVISSDPGSWVTEYVLPLDVSGNPTQFFRMTEIAPP